MGGGREGAGSSKMSSAMALVASSRRIILGASSSSSTASTCNATTTTTNCLGAQKRRSLAECVSGSSSSSSSSNSPSGHNHHNQGSKYYSLYKRPRTSWGKPHSNPSVLLCSPPLLPSSMNSPQPTPTPTPTDYDQHSFSTSNFIVPTNPSSVFFVKTEPLQNLAVFTLPGHSDQIYGDFEDDNEEEPRLHQVPSFFPIEHLLLDMNSRDYVNSAGAAMPLSLSPRSPGCFPASLSGSGCVSSTSPVSPLSVSTANSPLYSPPTDEYSISRDLRWARGTDCIEDESCDFLSDRFYEIETEMRCIMGENASLNHQHHHEHDLITELPDNLMGPAQCKVKLVVPKLEKATDDHDQNTSTMSELNSTSHTTQESDEEYRIDLTDFELEQGDSGTEFSDSYEQKPSVSNARKMALMLNYEDVINAWSDRGPPLADGNWPETMVSPDEVELDLAAWEPENQLIVAAQSFDMSLNVAGMMIQLPEASGSSAMMFMDGGGDHPAPPTSAVRQASVLRYREKRRTRLFSKKIRYEVRKLNAERRPRMKGRFIKRSSLD